MLSSPMAQVTMQSQMLGLLTAWVQPTTRRLCGVTNRRIGPGAQTSGDALPRSWHCQILKRDGAV
jgi:hypothetical protein